MDQWDWQVGVTGDMVTRQRLSPGAQLKDMIAVEAAYARALGQTGAVAPDLAEVTALAIEAAPIDTLRLSEEAAVDGMPVPPLIRQLRAGLPGHLHPALHSGMTSQDVMDTALSLALRDLLDVFEARLTSLCTRLEGIIEAHGAQALQGRTRMQLALPITLGHRVEGWFAPLRDHLDAMDGVRARSCVMQLGGPVGTGQSFPAPRPELEGVMAQALGLSTAGRAWHTDRTRIAELGSWLARLSGSLGKMGHDIALMAQQGVEDVRLRKGGASSAMAHKSNPVKAETLMALARFSSVQLGGLHLSLDHEQERSGAAWTLEWLILPALLEATGAGLLRADALLDDLIFTTAHQG